MVARDERTEAIRSLRETRRRRTTVCAGLIAILGGWAFAAERRPPEAPRLDGREAPRSTVVVKDGRLHVHVENRPQDWILEEVSREANVAITRVAGAGPAPVSVQLENVSVDEGLRWILGDQDAFFFYGADEKGRSVLRAVWIYPKGKGRGLEPVPPEAWASTKELERDLDDPDPAIRVRAIEAVIARKRDGARAAVLDALKDPDNRVRTRALYQSLNDDVDLPTEVLSDLAIGDPSPDVRFLALDALAADPDARTVAERASGDASAHVRERAREILRELDAASRTAPPPQPRKDGLPQAASRKP